MKNAILASLLAAALCACKHQLNTDDFLVEPPDNQDTTFVGMEPNSLKATRNGQAWEAHDFLVLSGGDSIPQFRVYHEKTKDGLNEGFAIFDTPISIGRHPLVKFPLAYWQGRPSAFMGWIYDGDQAIGLFSNDSLDTNGYVEVVSFDPETRVLKGKFEMRMTGFVANFPAFWDPEKLVVNPTVFTDGRFVVKVPE